MVEGPHCYAVRRVNPFLGVVEVAEISGARALSIDGCHWQIQVKTTRPGHTWGRDGPAPAAQQFFRFADWSTKHGLTRVPINPILDVGRMLTAGERMVRALTGVIDRLPFPFNDRFEHWLLDDAGEPLALLATTVVAEHMPESRALDWLATARPSDDVRANGREASEKPAGDRCTDRRLADALEQLIRGAAGATHRRSWYQRQPDGTGRPVDDTGVVLPASAFPSLPWRERWCDPDHARLLHDYHHRLAPQLLTLAGLADAMRRDLEQAARLQALRMTDLHRLYPRILQQDVLDTAQVEARLRRSRN